MPTAPCSGDKFKLLNIVDEQNLGARCVKCGNWFLARRWVRVTRYLIELYDKLLANPMNDVLEMASVLVDNSTKKAWD